MKQIGEQQRAAGYPDYVHPLIGKPGAGWYLLKGKTKFGPFTTAQMIVGLEGRQVDSLALVWRDGMPDWVKAARVFTPAGLSDSGRVELRDPLKRGTQEHW